MPAGPEYAVVEFGQTVLGPVIEQVGLGLTVTVLVQVLLQPLLLVIVSDKVNEPELPATTETDCEVLDPLIVPLPLIDQL